VPVAYIILPKILDSKLSCLILTLVLILWRDRENSVHRFKAKVAIEALKGWHRLTCAAKLAAKFEVHPTTNIKLGNGVFGKMPDLAFGPNQKKRSRFRTGPLYNKNRAGCKWRNDFLESLGQMSTTEETERCKVHPRLGTLQQTNVSSLGYPSLRSLLQGPEVRDVDLKLMKEMDACLFMGTTAPTSGGRGI